MLAVIEKIQKEKFIEIEIYFFWWWNNNRNLLKIAKGKEKIKITFLLHWRIKEEARKASVASHSLIFSLLLLNKQVIFISSLNYFLSLSISLTHQSHPISSIFGNCFTITIKQKEIFLLASLAHRKNKVTSAMKPYFFMITFFVLCFMLKHKNIYAHVFF